MIALSSKPKTFFRRFLEVSIKCSGVLVIICRICRKDCSKVTRWIFIYTYEYAHYYFLFFSAFGDKDPSGKTRRRFLFSRLSGLMHLAELFL